MKNKPPPRERKFAVDVSHHSKYELCTRTKSGFEARNSFIKVKFKKADLKKRIGFVLRHLCANSEGVSIHFADVEESQSLNKEYRGKNKPTDVLSFSSFERNLMLAAQGVTGEDVRSLGDLCVCLPVCLVQSKEHRATLSAETERMLVHGLVHLKGFDHERGESHQTVSEKLEKALRAALVSEFGKPQWIETQESF